MTMYLPNRDIRPTGFEAGEFLEPPRDAAAFEQTPRSPEPRPHPPDVTLADTRDIHGCDRSAMEETLHSDQSQEEHP
jgi:hypothetical protein